jgi:hypothetical protein
MPRLPSGLTLALSRHAIIEHDSNWFDCPDGRFWLWVPAPEMGPPPYDPNTTIMQAPEHAAVPTSRDEASRFVRVLEMREDGKYAWRGEWLAEFPKYRMLSAADTEAWKAWLARAETAKFLDETIERCVRMAEAARNAQGYFVGVKQTTVPDAEGWIEARPLRAGECSAFSNHRKKTD